MGKFLKRFRAAWDYAKFFRYESQADDWSQDDAANAYAFFRQGAGARLLFRLRNLALTNALQAAISGDKHKADISAGCIQTIANIEAHYRDLMAAEQSEQESPNIPQNMSEQEHSVEIKSFAALEHDQIQANNPRVEPQQGKVVDEVENAFMEAAKYADRGEDIPTELQEKIGIKSAVEKPDPVAEKIEAKTDPTETPEAKAERERDEQGRFKASDKAQEAISAETKTDGAESEFAKKQRESKEKEEIRKQRTWENLNKEREAVAEEKRKIEAERQELQKAKEAPAVQKPKWSSAQLFDAYQDLTKRANDAHEEYVRTGDERYHEEFKKHVDGAKKAMDGAQLVYEEENKWRQQEGLRQRDEAWKNSIEKVLPAESDLLDQNTPLAKEVLGLLNSDLNGKPAIEFFKSIPNGFTTAVQVSKWKIGHDQAAAANERATKAEAEVERLKALTAPSAGGITGPSTPRTFEKMSGPEKDAWLARQAHEWDRQHGFA